MDEALHEPTKKDVDQVISGFEDFLSEGGQLDSKSAGIDKQIAELEHRLTYASETFEQQGIIDQINDLKAHKQELTKDSANKEE